MRQPSPYLVLGVLAGSLALLLVVTFSAFPFAIPDGTSLYQASSYVTTTPFPTVVLPPMTPVPTMSIPWEQEPETREPLSTPSLPDADAPYDRFLSVFRVPNITAATQQSAAVVLGSVKQVGAARWSTPDGSRPENPWSMGDTVYTIFRPVLVSVDRQEKGGKLPSEILIEATGGRVGQDSFTRDDDLYQFKEGDRVLAFLTAASSRPGELQQLENRPLWKLIERYSITPDGKATNSYETLPIEQALQKIREVVSNDKLP